MFNDLKKLLRVTDSMDMDDKLTGNIYITDIEDIVADLDYTSFSKEDKDNVMKMCRFNDAASAWEIIITQIFKLKIRIEESTYLKIAELGETLEFESESWEPLKKLVLTDEIPEYQYVGSVEWEDRCKEFIDEWFDCSYRKQLIDRLKGDEDLAIVVNGVKGTDSLEWIEAKLPVLQKRSVVECVGIDTNSVRSILL